MGEFIGDGGSPDKTMQPDSPTSPSTSPCKIETLSSRRKIRQISSERSLVLLLFRFLLCRLLLRKQGEIFGVAFGLHFFDGNEMQRGRVNGVAPASRRRSVVENVAEMGVAPGCADLGALHAEGGVGFFDNAVR